MNAPHRHNEAVDRNIDRALAAIREAQPRSGLNSRILASLEQRVAAPQPARLGFSAHFALWTAASAALIAIASLFVLHHQSTTPAQFSKSTVILSGASRREAKSKDPEVARGETTVQPFSNTALAGAPPSTRIARQGRVRMLTHTMPTGVNKSLGPRDRSVATHLGSDTTNPDAQALADLHAPSHPAPPLPLTRQEKLFLHMLRYGNATQLAELNPMVREKEDAAEATAFKAFFPDPPPLQQSNGDNE